MKSLVEKFYEARRWWHNRRYYFHEFKRSDSWIHIQFGIEMTLIVVGALSLPVIAYFIGSLLQGEK